MLWLLIGYMFLFIHRPFEVWPVLGDFRIELIYMILTSVVWMLTPNKRFVSNSLTAAWAAFIGAVFICSIISPWSDICMSHFDNYYKYFVFYLMLVTVVREEDLNRVILAFVAVLAVYMLHSLWEYHNGRRIYRMGIDRMVGVDSTSSDPNALAATIVLGQVFVPVLWREFSSRLVRCFLISFVALSMLCIALTGSRGGFVMLLLVIAAVVWRSSWRGRLVLPVLLGAPLLFAALPEKLQNRFETIVNPDVGPKNAKISGEQRYEGFIIGMQLWQENPLSGVGPGAWRPATGRPINAHNLYGQLAGETGTLGVVTFGVVLVAFAVNVLRIRSVYRQMGWEPDFLHQLTGALGIALLLLLFAGTFGHNLFRYTWVWYAAFLVIAREGVERRLTTAGRWEWYPELIRGGATAWGVNTV
jgi:O-antigen ligase